ncbi:MAG TPA: VCBS repeat-containing protein, partial [Thermoanaerobaculia bacterium]|nr:VCBS repeat-containing protein [Thermoanaerobaculia bacterium]
MAARLQHFISTAVAALVLIGAPCAPACATSFATKVDVSVGIGPAAVATGDLNGDSILDFA